jgi:hypothetical protein
VLSVLRGEVTERVRSFLKRKEKKERKKEA